MSPCADTEKEPGMIFKVIYWCAKGMGYELWAEPSRKTNERVAEPSWSGAKSGKLQG